jgi:hypothetical protein
MLAYLSILAMDLFGVWLFFRAARRLFNPEKYISNEEKEHSKILKRLFGLTIDEHRPLRGNYLLGWLNLLMSLLIWFVFLFHLFFFATKLLGK